MAEKISAASHRLGANIAPAVDKKSDYVKIILDDNEKIPPTGQFFGINGRTFMLRAGEEVRVPIGIIDILDNAIETHPVKDGLNRVVGSKNRPRFGYRIIREEVDA